MSLSLSSLPHFLIPPLLATLLSTSGYKRHSLSVSGAISAWFVGALMLSVPLRTFGVALLIFYLMGSRATKVGKARKSALEQGPGVGVGARNAYQVIVGGGLAFAASIFWALIYTPDRWPFFLLSPFVEALRGWPGSEPRYMPRAWCPLTRQAPISRVLIYGSLGHFATCLGDTLASELGILSRTPPILITTLRTVPAGTNGGMSSLGTGASVGGGALMGVVYALGVGLEVRACRGEWLELAGVVMWGAVGGLVGSLLDSLLGATLQQTRYDASSKRVLTDGAVPGEGAEVKVISGVPVLSNIQVNLITATLTGVLLAWLAQ